MKTSIIHIIITLIILIAPQSVVRAETPSSEIPGDQKSRVAELVDTAIGSLFAGTRQKALNELKKYPKRDILDSWILVLGKTKHEKIKVEIIDYISDANDRRVVVPIALELRNPYHSVRTRAAMALMRCGDDRMYPYIIEMSVNPDPVYKIYTIEALFYLYDNRFYNILLNHLKDENKSIRIYAINCIRQNKLLQTIQYLRNIALSDANDEVRINAIEVIGDFADVGSCFTLYTTLNDKNREVRYVTVQALIKLNTYNSVHPVSSRLAVEEEDDIKELLIESILKLKKIGDITGLDKILTTDKNVKLRIRAAYALGVIYDMRSVQILLKGLKDREITVRGEVCSSLGYYKTRQIVDSLLEQIKTDRELYVRSASLYAIKRINDSKAAVTLFDYYTVEKDPIFREMLRRVIRYFLERFM